MEAGKRDEEGWFGSGDAMMRYAISRSVMFEARGPMTPHENARLVVGAMDTRPWLGFRP